MIGLRGMLKRKTGSTLWERLKPSGGLPVFSNGETLESNIFLEASVVVESDHIKLYFTSSTSDQANTIALATAPSIEAPFTVVGRVIDRGSGGAPSNRNAHSSCVIKENGVYHCWALNGYGFAGDVRDVWHYTSSDGITWVSDAVAALTPDMFPDVQGYGNLSVWPELVNGKYHMMAEYDSIAENIWKVALATATSLSGAWTIAQTLPTLQPANGMCGGCDLKYINNTWHCWLHYGSGELPALGGNLPTYLAYATSVDAFTWKIREAPFKKIESIPFGALHPTDPTQGTSQVADPWLFEQNGKTYLIAEYVKNSSPIASRLYYWIFNGTLSDFTANTGFVLK